jgi:hypothetical protein
VGIEEFEKTIAFLVNKQLCFLQMVFKKMKKKERREEEKENERMNGMKG